CVEPVYPPAAAEVVQPALVGICAGDQLSVGVGLQHLRMTDRQDRAPHIAGEFVHIKTAHGAAADERRTPHLTGCYRHGFVAPGMFAWARQRDLASAQKTLPTSPDLRLVHGRRTDAEHLTGFWTRCHPPAEVLRDPRETFH